MATEDTKVQLTIDQSAFEKELKSVILSVSNIINALKIPLAIDESDLVKSINNAVKNAAQKVKGIKIKCKCDCKCECSCGKNTGQSAEQKNPKSGNSLKDAIDAGNEEAEKTKKSMKSYLDFSDGLKSFGSGFKDFADKLTKLSPEVENFAGGAIDGVIKIIDVMQLLGSGLGVLLEAKILFAGLSAGAESVGGVIGALALPIGIIIASVAALYLAWQTNFGGIREATASVIDSITTIVRTFMGWMKALWEGDFLFVKTIVTTVWTEIETIFSTAFDLIASLFKVFALAMQGDWGGMWTEIQNMVTNYIECIMTLFTNWWNMIVTIWSSIWQSISSAISGLLQSILSTVSVWMNQLVANLAAIGASLWQAAVTAFQSVLAGFVSVWTTIEAWLSTAFQGVVNFISGIGQSLFNVGASIFNSLWDGIKSVWDGIVNWVNECIDWLAKHLKFWDNNSKSMQKTKNQTNGSHYNGLSYVPFDGYTATLHRGEMVLTQKEATIYRETEKAGAGDTTVIINSPKALSPAETAREFRRVQRELAFGF